MCLLKTGDNHVTFFDGLGGDIDLRGTQACVAARTGQSSRFAQCRGIDRLGTKAVAKEQCV